MTLRFRPSLSSLRTASVLVLAIASGAACTAIFAPRDSVQRCGTGDDCEQPDDTRYAAVCRFDPENTDLDSTKVDKICVADFKGNIGCDPTKYTMPPDHPFPTKIEQCENLELGCDTDKLGSLGCAPDMMTGSCNGDLELRDGICVEEGSNEVVGGPQNVDQAIADQFCKSFFCDDAFVCDSETTKCVRCDPNADFGVGGCGTLYANGEPAPFYVLDEELDHQCAHGDASADEPVFGECP